MDNTLSDGVVTLAQSWRHRGSLSRRRDKSAYVPNLCGAVTVFLLSCLPAAFAKPVAAVASSSFLNSIGVVTSFPDRGQPVAKTVAMIRYCGIRWVRAGIEGLTNNGPSTIATLLELHRDAGVKVSWGLVSGGADIKKLLATGRVLAKAGAILAFEGDNEPNNWGVIYNGEKGGGRELSWVPVAKLQRDLYKSVKSDPALSRYPVWSVSEPGAERENVGLQFLSIPPGAGTLMPTGTRYADFANVHNYIFHPNSPHLEDNKTWNAADPTSASRVDGLFGNFGLTWARRYPGYPEGQLASLPRVTTETGLPVTRSITEKLQGLSLMNMYLAQFTRGYAYTAVYLLRDRTDESGNQAFGFFRPDYSPRLAAVYLHNLTTILADEGSAAKLGQLDFSLENQSATVHYLLLERSDQTFDLILWGERLAAHDTVEVQLATIHPSIALFDPTVGVKPIQLLSNARSIEITLSDHPIVVALPAGAR